MKKENFASLALATVGGFLFAMGMCMCLIAEWNAFRPGLIMGVIGAVILAAIPIIRRKMLGKPPVKLSGRMLGKIALGVIGALTLGTGMCMTMVWEGLLVWGIAVGLIGIVLLLCLIPACKGLK